MPDEKACLDVDLLSQLVIFISVFASVINHEFVINSLVYVAWEEQIVVFDPMLMVSSRIALICVQLTIEEDQLLASWEKVTLGSHTKPYLWIIVD